MSHELLSFLYDQVQPVFNISRYCLACLVRDLVDGKRLGDILQGSTAVSRARRDVRPVVLTFTEVVGNMPTAG